MTGPIALGHVGWSVSRSNNLTFPRFENPTPSSPSRGIAEEVGEPVATSDVLTASRTKLPTATMSFIGVIKAAGVQIGRGSVSFG